MLQVGNWKVVLAILVTLATFHATLAAAVASEATFPVEGKMLVGVNYWGSKAGIRMWRVDAWDEASIEKDIAALAAIDGVISVEEL